MIEFVSQRRQSFHLLKTQTFYGRLQLQGPVPWLQHEVVVLHTWNELKPRENKLNHHSIVLITNKSYHLSVVTVPLCSLLASTTSLHSTATTPFLIATLTSLIVLRNHRNLPLHRQNSLLSSSHYQKWQLPPSSFSFPLRTRS